MKGMKRFAALMLCALFTLLSGTAMAQDAPLEENVPVELSCPSAILIEASTGQVIFEKNADEQRPVASVTKIMTILLTLEAIEQKAVSVDDQVMVSQNAAGMGGSQALLDANQPYALGELLKSTIVASANDAAVALAEHIAGAQEVFVQRMNARAKELGLENTNYVNCTGLPVEGQHTTARDVATLSRQLDRFPLYYKYSTIWMDTIAHKGGRVTELTNTNRLIRFYENCDGYKTGSTNEAKYCVSASAKRGGLRLIAVVLGAPGGQVRFDEARKMLDYGFANYQMSKVVGEGADMDMQVAVKMGLKDSVGVLAGEEISMLLKKGEESALSIEVALPETITAPVQKGEAIGEITVRRGDKVVATAPAVAAETVGMPGMLEALLRIWENWRVN